MSSHRLKAEPPFGDEKVFSDPLDLVHFIFSIKPDQWKSGSGDLTVVYPPNNSSTKELVIMYRLGIGYYIMFAEKSLAPGSPSILYHALADEERMTEAVSLWFGGMFNAVPKNVFLPDHLTGLVIETFANTGMMEPSVIWEPHPLPIEVGDDIEIEPY